MTSPTARSRRLVVRIAGWRLTDDRHHDLEATSKELNVVDRMSDKRLAAVSVAFVIYTAVMLLLERRMRATGGPGIIPFELAGSAAQAEDIMTRWGSDGQRAARLSLWLDFGYMATYGTFTALLVDRARRRRGHPAALPATVIVAVAADAVEGVSLLQALKRTRVAVHARRAQIAALIKFAVLLGALGYIATDGFISVWLRIVRRSETRIAGGGP